MRTAIVLVTLFLLGVAIPSVNATESREIDCISVSTSWIILDQQCAVFALGSVAPGETHTIQFDTDKEVDVLMFSQAGYAVYSNDQSYRASNVWDEEGTLESINGTAEWRWSAPINKSQTNWYLVIDNLDHPQDDDQGASGGYTATGSTSIESATVRYWTLHDSLWKVESGEGTSVAGPFSFQEGTQILIEAFEIDGTPDLFFMTEQQKTLYLQDYSNDFRISDTDLLSITESTSRSWLVPQVYSNEPLYLMMDNTASPTGGGSGTDLARLGVVLSILPILDVEISTTDNLQQVDVGQIISLSTSNTPNDWNQLDPSGFSWSTPDATCSTSTTGSSVSLCWNSEGQRTVEVTASSIDGRTDTESVIVNVIDSTPPSSEILVSGNIVRGVGESFTISGRSSDNGEIATEEWLIDGQVIQTENTSRNTSLTYSFDLPSDLGSHTITYRVTDGAGLTSQSNISIEVSDTTPPVTSSINGTEVVNPGESVSFSITASDPESSTLVYEWDLDGSIDSDSNGISDDDVDMIGPSITTTYETGGSRFISCVVTNEAGSSTVERFTITVLNPQQEEPSSSSNIGMIAIIVLAIILVLGVIGAFLWQRSTARRAAEIIAEQEAAKIEETPPPTAEEQAQMYASRRSSDDFESIAGMSSMELSKSSPRSVGSSAVLDDLISEEDEVQLDEEETPISPTSPLRNQSVSSPSVLGIEIPVMDTISSPKVPDIVSPKESEVEAVETIKVTCSSCAKDFEVDLPPGVTSGKTACPHCGSIEMVQR